jgi:hypothetical protein
MFVSRRLAWVLGPVGVLTGAAVLGASMLGAAHFAATSEVSTPKPPGGILDSSGTRSLPALPGRVGVAGGPVSLRYTFDGGVAKPITAVGGGHELWALGQNGGRLSLVPDGPGLALEYPRRCHLAHERECPRAILEGDRDDGLNPGTRPLSYGASVLMTRADLADGANVLQKGYSVGGVSQFKLQVDHEMGHPSCVITGQQAEIYRAEPLIDVADGSWHDLACTRTENRLTMTVDGVKEVSVRIPPKLSIANAEPLRVGGKGANKGNDQFAGLIDNVYLTIS